MSLFVGIISILIGVLSTLLWIVMLFASAPNSSASHQRSIRHLLWLTGLGGFTTTTLAVILLFTNHSWLATPIAIIPAAALVITFVILAR